MEQNLLPNMFQQNLVPDKHNLFWDATEYCGDDNWLQNQLLLVVDGQGERLCDLVKFA